MLIIIVARADVMKPIITPNLSTNAVSKIVGNLSSALTYWLATWKDSEFFFEFFEFFENIYIYIYIYIYIFGGVLSLSGFFFDFDFDFDFYFLLLFI